MLMDIAKRLKTSAAGVLLVATCGPAIADFQLKPYAAFNAGYVRLSPDPGNSGLEVSSPNALGFNALIGLDLTHRWALEAGFADLGAATLESPALGEQDIAYSALSFSGLYNVWGNPQNMAARTGMWTYLRLGVNQMNNDSELSLEEADNIAVWAGLGVEWSVSSMFALRGEISSFDGDAQALTAGVVVRPFKPNSQRSRVPAARLPSSQVGASPKPELQSQTLPQAEAPKTQTSEPTQPSITQIGCETPVGNEPMGLNGCALITGVRRGIQFAPESDQLVGDSRAAILQLASAMKQAPGLNVEIRAYASSENGEQAAQVVSKQRVVAVARALMASSIDVGRLGARAFGNQQPVVTLGTSAGEVLPNRIEIVVKP